MSANPSPYETMLNASVDYSANLVRFLPSVYTPSVPTQDSSSSQASIRTDSDLRLVVTKPSSSQESPSTRTSESFEALEFRRGLEACLDNDFLDLGNNNSADYHVKSWLRRDPTMVQMEFGRLAVLSQDNPRRLTGLLSILSHCDRADLQPMSELFVGNCFSFEWPDVQEYAIGVLESWADPEIIVRTLKYRVLTPQWLDDYRKQVLSEYEGI